MSNGKYIVGFLIVTILATASYFMLPGKVKFRVDNDKSTIYVFNENSRWIAAGREYSKLLDGNRKMLRSLVKIKRETIIDNESKTVIETRTTPYIRGPVIKETWHYDGNINDVNFVPIYHKIEVYNATGKYFKYEVRDLYYSGDTFKLDGNQVSMEFNRNIKVTWWEGYNLGWVYKSGSMYVKSKKLESDYEVFYVRLFDPQGFKELCTEREIEKEIKIPVYINKTVNVPCDILKESCLTDINGTGYKKEKKEDFSHYEIKKTDETICEKNGYVKISGKITAYEDSWCRVIDGEVWCIHDKEGGKYGIWGRNDGSVTKWQVNIYGKIKNFDNSLNIKIKEKQINLIDIKEAK